MTTAGLQVSLYFLFFLYFLTSPIFSYLIQKLPVIPIMFELKGKKAYLQKVARQTQLSCNWLFYCLWSQFSRSFCASSRVKGHLLLPLIKLLKLLMERFLKETEENHLLTVEYSKSDNLLSNSQIEVGENTRFALPKLTTDQKRVALTGMK